jgi:RimJ/RimL family protein N-acetyltransferase
MLAGTLTRQQSDSFLDRIVERWRTEGYSLWAVERTEDGAFIGTVGLTIPSFAPERTVEVGWRLAHDAWGHGYATEAARVAARFAFEVLELPEIVSYTAARNVRSRRVMDKLGMARVDPSAPFDFVHPRLADDHPLRPHVTYRLSREAWERTRGE